MNKPWFNKPSKLTPGTQIAIIGGGISGIMLLLHLRNAGYKATLIEKEKQILSGASGNPAAILDPFLSASETIEKSFYLKAHRYALKFYEELGGDILERYDLLKVASSGDQMRRFEKLEQAYQNNFLTLSSEGLVCSPSGYVTPSKLRKMLGGRDTIVNGISITRLKQLRGKRWSLYDANDHQVLETDAVIISNSYLATKFEQTSHIELDNIAGQISLLSPQYMENNILCSEGYVTPVVSTEWGDANICGATFEKDGTLELTDDAHLENLSKAPFVFSKANIIGGRRGIRAMTNDHFPLCGPVPNSVKYKEDYNGLHHGPRHKKFPAASYHPNLFINVGLGARGFLTAPILASHLTALIGGNQSPLEDKVSNALHPGRFIIRALSKK